MTDLLRPGIPGFLAHLDVWNGHPVAWSQSRDADGKPMLYLDPQRRDTCWAERRCGVCYLDLDYRLGFLVQAPTDERARAARWHLQAGVHPRCAPYAGLDAHPGMTVYVCITRGYKVRMWTDPTDRGRPAIRKAHAAPYTSLERLPVPTAVRPDGTRRTPSGLVVP
jgi:hypothetical protein